MHSCFLQGHNLLLIVRGRKTPLHMHGCLTSRSRHLALCLGFACVADGAYCRRLVTFFASAAVFSLVGVHISDLSTLITNIVEPRSVDANTAASRPPQRHNLFFCFYRTRVGISRPRILGRSGISSSRGVVKV